MAIEDKVVGFCVITKTDYIPDCVYMPWISFVFADENYRGNRISQKMIIETSSKEHKICSFFIEGGYYGKYLL